jgi:hypothetical protein
VITENSSPARLVSTDLRQKSERVYIYTPELSFGIKPRVNWGSAAIQLSLLSHISADRLETTLADSQLLARGVANCARILSGLESREYDRRDPSRWRRIFLIFIC